MHIACLLAAMIAVPEADVLIENAHIWSDGLAGFAEFAAVDEGRLIHVGARDESWIGPATIRVDADGRTVVPGLLDSHVHMLNGGLQLSRLQLRDATDKADFVRLVREWAAALSPDRWILGGRWSVESWDEPTQPTREWIDSASGQRPLFLPRMDGHSALVNSAALRLAGIDASGPPDPVGGVIDRDPATGEPTGILRESAMGLVGRLVPAMNEDDRLAALDRAIDHAIANGITAVSDIPSLADLDVYRRLTARPDDPRVRLFLFPTAADWARAAQLVSAFPTRPLRVQVNGYKAYLDGSLGSRTAMMVAPFENNEPARAGWRGIWREGVEDGRFARNTDAAKKAGRQAIVHAIGDDANRLLLDTFGQARGDDLAAARCRSEHAQHLRPEDILRFAHLGVIASMQPFHKADDGRYAEAYLGAARCRSSYAFKSLLDAGAVLAFGSDWPVVMLDPWRGVEAAVTGRTLDGKTWQPQENLTVAEAVRAYTVAGAYAVFADHEIGRILPGYRAEFVILERSPFGASVDFAAIRRRAVFVEGRRVDDGGSA